MATKAQANEAFVRLVQESLNRLGQGLKVDGWAGAATAEAFNIAMSRALAGGTGTAANPSVEPEAWAVDAHVRSVLGKQPKAARKITEVVIHCTATPAGREVSVETIDGWHKARGWAGIGYHYVVHLNGAVEAGRPEAQVGAHEPKVNNRSIGVVYVGGTDADGKPQDTRTPAQREALMALTRGLIVKYPAVTRVSGHNEYAAKACPSFDVRTDPLGSLV